MQRCLHLANCGFVPKSGPSLGPSQRLDGPLSQLKFGPMDQLPTQSYICVLGALLAVLDLNELASLPSPDESVNPPNTSGTSLVMDVGQCLLSLVDKYVA